MLSTRSPLLATALAAGTCTATVQLFVQPSTGAKAAHALRGTAAQQPASASLASLAASAPLGGLAVAGVAVQAMRRLRTARKAAAKAPSPPPFNPSKQLGAMAPLGFFDPAGFSKVGDESGFRNLRAAELKHGRVAMMAALGFVAQQSIKFPGFDSVPAGWQAVTTAPGTYGFVALFLASGALELAVWTQDEKKEPGNFGDPVGLSNIFGYGEDIRAKELNNGRFAMFAAIGILAAELLTGKVGIQQFA